MKKIIFTIVASCTLVGCMSQKNIVETVQETGVLKVAIYDSQSNFTEKAGSNYQGIEPNLVEEIAKSLNVTVEYIPKSHDELVTTIDRGDADIAIGKIVTDDLQNSESLSSHVYGNEEIYLVTSRDNYDTYPFILEESELPIGILMTDDGYFGQGAVSLEGITNIKQYSQDSVQQMIDDIYNGTTIGIIIHRELAEMFLQNDNFLVKQINDLNTTEYIVVVSSMDRSLLGTVNETIEQMNDKS